MLKRATIGGYQEAVNILVEQNVTCADLLRRAACEGDLEAARLLLALNSGDFN